MARGSTSQFNIRNSLLILIIVCSCVEYDDSMVLAALLDMNAILNKCMSDRSLRGKNKSAELTRQLIDGDVLPVLQSMMADSSIDTDVREKAKNLFEQAVPL